MRPTTICPTTNSPKKKASKNSQTLVPIGIKTSIVKHLHDMERRIQAVIQRLKSFRLEKQFHIRLAPKFWIFHLRPYLQVLLMENAAHSLTKSRILDMSFYAFNQRGYQAVSMDEVSRALKISKKTIYKHFTSKEEILESAMVSMFERIELRLKAWEAEHLSGKAFLQYFDICKDYQIGLSELLRGELQRDIPYLHERIETFERQTLLRSLVACLKAQRNARILDYPSPTREFAQNFHSMLFSLSGSSEQMATSLIQATAKGLAPKKKKKK